MLIKLAAAPVYFHRKGRGRFRPAPAETVKLALAALERRRAQEAAIADMAQAMQEGRLPAPILAAGASLLVRPDKQTLEYRALERACEAVRKPAPRLLLDLGLFANAKALHLACFEREYFPAGVGFPEMPTVPEPPGGLPLSAAQAFSIDDSTTTEIDDCLSVQTLPDGRLRVGVHIAAPSLAGARDDALDSVARERMSTVYMPGEKITMLPEGAIRPSLDEGTERAVISLYGDLDESGTEVVARQTVVERIAVPWPTCATTSSTSTSPKRRWKIRPRSFRWPMPCARSGSSRSGCAPAATRCAASPRPGSAPTSAFTSRATRSASSRGAAMPRWTGSWPR